MTTANDTQADHDHDELRDEDEHFEWLSISDIHDDPENLRESYEGIEELAHSIKSQGLIQPITVRRNSNGIYTILAGHRRKRALILAGKTRTRVIVKHKEYLSEDVIAGMLIENGHRSDLNPMEQAFGLQKIKSGWENKHGQSMTQKQLADMVGRTQVWVSDRIKLLSLSADEQEAVRTGRMTIGEGKRVGSLNAGTTRPGAVGKKSAGYFTSHHGLGDKAKNRCKSLGHKAGGPNYLAVACGKCWEHVIRTNERDIARNDAHKNGRCGICNSELEVEKSDE